MPAERRGRSWFAILAPVVVLLLVLGGALVVLLAPPSSTDSRADREKAERRRARLRAQAEAFEDSLDGSGPGAGGDDAWRPGSAPDADGGGFGFGTGRGAGNAPEGRGGRVIVLDRFGNLRVHVPGERDLPGASLSALKRAARRAADAQKSSDDAGGDSDADGNAPADGEAGEDPDEEAPDESGTLTGTVSEDGPSGVSRPVPNLRLRLDLTEGGAIVVEAVTDAAGRFTVLALPPGGVRITVLGTAAAAPAGDTTGTGAVSGGGTAGASPGATAATAVAERYYPTSEHYAVIRVGETTVADLRVTRDHDLVGRVVDGAGAPLADVTVRFFRDGWGRRRAALQAVATDASGLFTVDDLPDAVYRVTAEADGHAPASLEAVRPVDYGPAHPLEIALVSDSRVFGRVTDRQGTPLTGAHLTAAQFVEGQPIMKSAVITDADGRYALPVEARSTNRITATRAGYRTRRVDGIVPGRHGIDFVLRPNGKAVLTGVVYEPTGALAATVKINGKSTALKDGRFWFAVTPGSVTLTLVGPGGASAVVSAEAVASLETDVGRIDLAPATPLVVVVRARETGGASTTVTDATVTLPATGERLTAPTTAVDGEAAYRLLTAPAERAFTIDVTHPDFPAQRAIAVAALPDERPDPLVVELAPGTRAVLVRVRTPAGEPIAGALIERLAGGQWTTDERGYALLEGLAEARVRVRISAPGYVPKTRWIATEDMAAESAPELPPLRVVTLAAAGSLWGTVTMQGLALDAARLPSLTIEVPAAKFKTTATPVAVSLEAGTVWRYEVQGVPAGDAWVYDLAHGLYPRGLPARVTLGEATQLDIDYPGATTARVRFRWADDLTPFGGASLYLYECTGWTDIAAGHTDPNGWVTFSQLPPGGYALSIITNGSSDQRLFALDIPPLVAGAGVPVVTQTIELQRPSRAVVGRVLVTNTSVAYRETAPVAVGTGVSQFALAIRLADEPAVRTVSVSGGPFADAPAVAAALKKTQAFTSLGLTAGGGTRLRIGRTQTGPAFFAVSPADAGARALFGATPFMSNHRARNTKVALERLDQPLQSLLAGYVSVDLQGYFTFRDCLPGRYRARLVPHYTKAKYRHAFAREVSTVSTPQPFVTLWTEGAGSYANVTGTLTFSGPGILRAAGGVIVYADALDDPTTSYPPSLGPRGLTRRSGYYFGSVSGSGGSYSVPRLARGHRYRLSIHASGFAPMSVEVDVPLDGPENLTAPPTRLLWRAE